jgi:DNA-binding response OmpR family regulator
MAATGRRRPYDEPVSTVVIIEDDRTLASVVANYLQRAGHDPLPAHDGAGGLALVAARHPDLVLLDVMLPGMDGIDVCRRLRAAYPDLPVVILTALGEVDDRIAGLEVGADDYIAKPFSPRELMLRIDSVLRRTGHAMGAAPKLRAGPIEVDTAARRASREGTELSLTAREFDLLAFLVTHHGVALSRERLMREVWGWSFGDQSTVTVHVRRLREKIESDPTKPALIRTVWGVGYRLELPQPDVAESLP